MPLPKIKYQLVPINVTVANQEIAIDFETDKLYNTVTGINALLTDTDAKYSVMSLNINNQEVFPEKFEILRIHFRPNAPFGYDYHTLKEPGSGSKVKGVYKDNGLASAYPYLLVIALKLENKEQTDAGKVD